jgi:hypothetical protein
VIDASRSRAELAVMDANKSELKLAERDNRTGCVIEANRSDTSHVWLIFVGRVACPGQEPWLPVEVTTDSDQMQL